MRYDDFIEVLKTEVRPATGCTEPVAIALAVAWAYKGVQEDVERISLVLSANVFKNAKAVGIPVLQTSGIDMAVYLGLSIPDPNLDLTLFSDLGLDTLNQARALQEKLPMKLTIAFDVPSVYIEATIETTSGTHKAIIQDNHTNLVYLQHNQETVKDNRRGQESEKLSNLLVQSSFAEVLEGALNITAKDGDFLLEGARMNTRIAEAGWDMDGGMKIGAAWQAMERKNLVGRDITNRIAAFTAAASDARMAGLPMPVVTSAGSGNHGIVAILPIALLSEHLNASPEKTIRALAVSHMVTLFIKVHTGRLSPVCGCAVASGSGAGAGMAYLLGGSEKDLESAVQNVIASLAGMVCDGGKVGCALKLCTSAVTAYYSALLACEGIGVPSGNGIIADTIEETIRYLGRISNAGMENMDRTLVDVLRHERQPE